MSKRSLLVPLIYWFEDLEPSRVMSSLEQINLLLMTYIPVPLDSLDQRSLSVRADILMAFNQYGQEHLNVKRRMAGGCPGSG